MNGGYIVEYELKEVRRIRIKHDANGSTRYSTRYNFIGENDIPTNVLETIDSKDKIEGITFNK